MFELVVAEVMAMPVTTDAETFPVRPLTEFFETFLTPAPDASVIPVTEPPEILLTVLPETLVGPASKPVEIPIIVPESDVTLFMVFPFTFFVGAPPFVLLMPVKFVTPASVKFEKLLLLKLFVFVAPGSDPLSVKRVTVPPDPVLLKPVTTELLFTFFVPPAGAVLVFEMNVMLPVVFTVIFVNVLLVMF